MIWGGWERVSSNFEVAVPSGADKIQELCALTWVHPLLSLLLRGCQALCRRVRSECLCMAEQR